jgi:hypothetical protein
MRDSTKGFPSLMGSLRGVHWRFPRGSTRGSRMGIPQGSPMGIPQGIPQGLPWVIPLHFVAFFESSRFARDARAIQQCAFGKRITYWCIASRVFYARMYTDAWWNTHDALVYSSGAGYPLGGPSTRSCTGSRAVNCKSPN